MEMFNHNILYNYVFFYYTEKMKKRGKIINIFLYVLVLVCVLTYALLGVHCL